MATRIQVRRDSAANWTSNNPTLAEGEIGFETDTGLLKVGKSNTPWVSLEYTQDSLPSYELYAKIQDFDPNTSPQDDDVTDYSDMEVGDVLVLDADTTNSAFAIGDRVRANSVSEREYVFSNLSSALFNSSSANIRTELYNEETQQYDITPGDTFTFTTTNPNLAIKVGSFLSLYRNTNPIFGAIYVEVKSISSNRLAYTCELTGISRTEVFNEETQVWVPQEFTATSWNGLFGLGGYPNYHYPSYPQLNQVFNEGDSLAGLIPYAYLEGIVTGLNANSASITIDNLGPSGPPIWFENMKISLAPGRDGVGYGYNVARNPADPSFSRTENVDFQNMSLGQYVYLYKNDPGAYKSGDRVRVVFDTPDAWIEGWVVNVNKDFGGYIQVVTDDWNKNYTSLEPQSSAKISLIAEPSKSYQLRKRVWKDGYVGYSNSTFSASPTDIPQNVSSFIFSTNGYSLFENGDWIRAEFIDYEGTYGSRYQVYSDTWFEGIVFGKSGSGDSESFNVLITDFRNPNSYSGTEFKTSKISAPKYTYEFPQQVYTNGYWGIANNYNYLPLVGESGDIYGIAGSYQIGQQIRLQATNEARKIQYVGTYAIAEITGISYEANPLDPGSAYDEKLTVTILEKNEGETPDSYASFNVGLYASDGAQGPGYEVSYDSNVHALPDDVSTVWDNYGLSQTSWNVGNQYTIPGDFSNSSFQIGSYVKYYFEDPSFPDTPYIEGWIYQLYETYAVVLIQRWSNNSNWYSVAGYMPSVQPIFPAHFEPGYNFDKRINVSGGYVNSANNIYSYVDFNDQIGYAQSMWFDGYHRGSYNPGDYVVISSRSNPGIKVFAYIGSIGYADFADSFAIFPIEVLTWDASEEDDFSDWILSIASPPKKEYKLTNPLPLPWDLALDPFPSPYPPAIPFSLPELLDIVGISGDPGLFKVGNLVRAVSKSEPTAAFYGEITELGSASNNFTTFVEVSDVSEWTDDPENTYYDWELSLGEKPVEYQLAAPLGRGTYQNTTITAEDMGKIIYTSNGDPITLTLDVSPNSVPHGSQVTIIQRWNGTVEISPSPTSGIIYFAETDGLTEGIVTLKGIYSAATLINAEGFWILIGSFGSAYTPGGGG